MPEQVGTHGLCGVCLCGGECVCVSVRVCVYVFVRGICMRVLCVSRCVLVLNGLIELYSAVSINPQPAPRALGAHNTYIIIIYACSISV